MSLSQEGAVGGVFENRRARALASAVAFRDRSLERFQSVFVHTRKLARDTRRGTLTTLGDMSDGVTTLSLWGSVGSVALLATGVVARLCNVDDATNFFGEVGMATGTVGGFLSVTTALASDSFTRNVREMARR